MIHKLWIYDEWLSFEAERYWFSWSDHLHDHVLSLTWPGNSFSIGFILLNRSTWTVQSRPKLNLNNVSVELQGGETAEYSSSIVLRDLDIHLLLLKSDLRLVCYKPGKCIFSISFIPYLLRVVQTIAILFLKSKLCRIRLFPTLISKIKWLWSELHLTNKL